MLRRNGSPDSPLVASRFYSNNAPMLRIDGVGILTLEDVAYFTRELDPSGNGSNLLYNSIIYLTLVGCSRVSTVKSDTGITARPTWWSKT